MPNFSPKLEEQSDDQLRSNINEKHTPEFALLSSDELTRRSLDKLRETTVELDKSNKKYTHALGIFALLQIIIAGLQLVLDIKSSQDTMFSVFIGILFIIILIWFTKEFKSIK